MGVNIRLRDADFRISAEHKDDALTAIRELMNDQEAGRSGFNSHGPDSFASMRGVNPEDWDYLKEAMRDWRFPITLDESRDVVGIGFTGEKIGDEIQLFAAIAPFVDSGSYLEFSSRGAQRYRLVFTADDVLKKKSETTFE